MIKNILTIVVIAVALSFIAIIFHIPVILLALAIGLIAIALNRIHDKYKYLRMKRQPIPKWLLYGETLRAYLANEDAPYERNL